MIPPDILSKALSSVPFGLSTPLVELPSSDGGSGLYAVGSWSTVYAMSSDQKSFTAKFVGILMRQMISLVRTHFLIGPRITSAHGNMIAFGCVRCFELSPERR